MPVSKSRIIDLLLYACIGLGFAAGLLWLFSHGYRIDAPYFIKWGGLAAHTFLLFGFIIANHKREYRITAFWGILCVLGIAHLALFVIAFRRIEHWSLIWFCFAYPIEYVTIDWLLRRANLPR